jgi:hypothetical protein
MGCQGHGATLEHHTPALNRLDEVFGALGNEDKAGLVGMEFQNPTESLLCHHREIVGVI